MKYLFGPVNSRRLGLSQGIDLLTPKICNFDCIYCEVGPTTKLTCERQEYTPTVEILAEIDALLQNPEAVDRLDYFTITSSGEPTLHSGIGQIIRHLKQKTAIPVAVLTNGSLLHVKVIRDDLMAADLVIPSLDTVRPESYRKLNRAARCSDLPLIVKGLIHFRRQFKGQIWLEILLVKNINDSAEDIAALQDAILKIKPDRIQLNTVVRPPLESYAKPLNREEMELIAKKFDRPVEIIVDFEKRKQEGYRPIIESEILQMLKRRPCTADDVSEALDLHPHNILTLLNNLENSGKIEIKIHNDRQYFQTKTD